MSGGFYRWNQIATSLSIKNSLVFTSIALVVLIGLVINIAIYNVILPPSSRATSSCKSGAETFA
jgi:hypothetical protein